jgi:DNA repair photolyase
MDTIPAKTLLTRTKSTAWFGAEYNMNIYRGCCHGCIYCDSRSDCYRETDFARVKAKANALTILRDNLRGKVKPGVVSTGAMSDPYNPHEAREKLTRSALELLSAYGFGVAIATKGALVARDTDILNEIREHAPVLVKLTVTTADDNLRKLI